MSHVVGDYHLGCLVKSVSSLGVRRGSRACGRYAIIEGSIGGRREGNRCRYGHGRCTLLCAG